MLAAWSTRPLSQPLPCKERGAWGGDPPQKPRLLLPAVSKPKEEIAPTRPELTIIDVPGRPMSRPLHLLREEQDLTSGMGE